MSEKKHASITTVATEKELEGIALKKDRGTVIRITFEIVYPDHSKKIVAHDYEWLENLSAIHLSENVMSKEEKELFSISDEDWEQNPAFIKIDKEAKMAGSCCKRAGHSGDDCWSCNKKLNHNDTE